MKLVSITVEGMHSVDKKVYRFGNANYLHGANGAGKSTALQAIQLAILGYIPGTNKTSSAIFAHANNHTMAVTAVLDDDGSSVIIRRIWTGSKGKVNSVVEITPEGYNIESCVAELELPVFNFNQFVGMTSNALKDWFINYLPKEGQEVDWEHTMKEAIKSVKLSEDSSIVADARKSLSSETLNSSVEEARFLNEYFKQLLSFKKSELARAQATVQNLVYYDSYSGDTDIESMESKISQLRELQLAIARRDQVVSTNQRILDSISQLGLNYDDAKNDPEYVKLVNELSELEKIQDELGKKCYQLGQEYAEMMSKRTHEQSKLDSKQSVIDDAGTCPYTKQKCDSIQKWIDELKKEATSIEAAIQEIDNRASDIHKYVEESNAEHSRVSSEISRIMTRMSVIQANYAKLSDLKSQLYDVPETVTSDLTSEDISKQISELQDSLIKASANIRYSELSSTLIKQKFVIEQEIEAIKLLQTLTGPNGLQSTLMKKPFELLGSRIDEYIKPMFGENVKAGFTLSEKANSFNFGLYRDDAYIAFDHLSSGEKCLYTLALMIVITDMAKTDLKMILIDDLLDHLDDNNITSLFNLLHSIEHIQFVLAGVKPYTGPNASDVVIEVK